MSWHMSQRYGHVILGSGYPVLTAVNSQYCECPIHAATRLRQPSLPFDSLHYPTRTICRRVCTYILSVNHVTTKREEVDHILWVWGSATVYVESTWVHYIDFSAIVQVVKVSIIVSSVHVKISTLFVVSHFWSAQVSPEWRLNQGFATQKKCPFPLNRGFYSIEVMYTKIMWAFFWDQILCPQDGGVPWTKVSKGEVPLNSQ